MPWEREDTEKWLTDYPLPQDFVWNGEKAAPRYRVREGYGQWLRTAGSYHPALRGLFVLVHEILVEKSAKGDPAPTPEELAAELHAHAQLQGSLGIEEPAPAPKYGQGMHRAAIERGEVDPDAPPATPDQEDPL